MLQSERADLNRRLSRFDMCGIGIAAFTAYAKAVHRAGSSPTNADIALLFHGGRVRSVELVTRQRVEMPVMPGDDESYTDDELAAFQSASALIGNPAIENDLLDFAKGVGRYGDTSGDGKIVTSFDPKRKRFRMALDASKLLAN